MEIDALSIYGWVIGFVATFILINSFRYKPFILFTTSFVAGYLFKMGMGMALQDMIGLQAFLNLVENGWVDRSPFVGGAIALVAFLWLYIAKNKIKRYVEKRNQAQQSGGFNA